MGIGNAFAALTEGWFGGVERRNQWDDRKRKQEREDKLDAQNAERFKWEGLQQQREAETHGALMGQYADTNRDRDQVYDDQMDVRAAAAKDLSTPAAKGEGLGIRPSVPEPAAAPPASVAKIADESGPTMGPVTISTKSPALLPAAQSEGLGISPADATVVPSTTGAAKQPATTTEVTPASPPITKAPADGLRVLEDGTVIPPRSRSLTANESAIVAKAAKEGRLRPLEDSVGGHAEANARAAAGMRGGARERSLLGDVGEVAGEITRTGQMAGDMIAGVAERGANAMRRADGYILGREPLGIREVDPRKTGALADTIGRGGNRILDALGISEKSKDTVPAADPNKPAMQQAASAAADVLEKTPSGQAVTRAAGAIGAGLGVSPETKHPAAQREKAADAFIDHFGTTLMPNTVKALVLQGRFDEAQKLQDWADTAGAKKGLRAWSKAGLAAAIGDERGFISNIADAYNTTGYFDDGYSMISEKSGFLRSENGDVAGAYVTFKDDQTGREFKQMFSGADDLMQMGIQMLSPEKILENQMEQQRAMVAAQKDVAEKEAEAAREMERRLDGIAKTIFDSANKDITSGEGGMSYAEARAQAEEQLGLRRSAAGDAVWARVPE